jgi:hypothetical protein
MPRGPRASTVSRIIRRAAQAFCMLSCRWVCRLVMSFRLSPPQFFREWSFGVPNHRSKRLCMAVVPCQGGSFRLKTLGQARRPLRRCWVANRTGRTGSAAGASVGAFPRLVGMVFADPAGVLAQKALHAAALSSLSAPPHDDPQRIIRQRSRLRLVPRDTHPHVTPLVGGQDRRHGLGVRNLLEGPVVAAPRDGLVRKTAVRNFVPTEQATLLLAPHFLKFTFDQLPARAVPTFESSEPRTEALKD